MKLSGSDEPYAGRVKVRYQGVWGTLCGHSWRPKTAEVLCRRLGYQGVELDLTLYNKFKYPIPLEIYDAALGPAWFDGFACGGHEKALSECILERTWHCLNDNVELICKVENVSVNGERF